ncbi:uncharacterized protein LOC124957556 [Vespa velutina]|uniref:uncharacterized protein LOC124957556 n=1 Tax=Vespa velutina TaxID=202808 RepID=UPI001FB52158|nr:uncharacterized protein LOC124957556 [Vespa velutina]
MQKPLCILSARFPTEADKWDKLQDRLFSMSTTSTLNNIRSKIDPIHSNSESKHLETEPSSERLEVKRLLEKDKLRIAYDKLSLTYGGYRPCVGLGIPLEKKVFPIVHPDLSISRHFIDVQSPKLKNNRLEKILYYLSFLKKYINT